MTSDMKGEHPSVLVVDDEEDLCWVLKNALAPDDYSVVTVNNGTEAMFQIKQRSFVIAFVDVKLPDLDGLALVAHIREHSPNTSVVLLSGYYYAEDQIIIQGLLNGLFSGFIAKPFDLNEVRLLARQAVVQASRGS